MTGSDLPKIGAPATRALAGLGVTQLEQVTDYSEAELLALHGFGPRTLRILGDALAVRGLAMRPSTRNMGDARHATTFVAEAGVLTVDAAVDRAGS